MREDLRKNIIPSQVNSLSKFFKSNFRTLYKGMSEEDFFTEDYIYINSYEEIKDEIENISSTDFAVMCNLQRYGDYVNPEKIVGRVWLRTAKTDSTVITVGEGKKHTIIEFGAERIGIGVMPSLHYSISKADETQIVEDGKKHIINIGEYPKTRVDDDLSKELEELYHGGALRDELIATGRWFSTNGQTKDKSYAGKHFPEFEFNGERYVRIVTNADQKIFKPYEEKTIIKWVKVEPISFIIKNWNQMPKSINPEGDGTAEFFDLRSSEVILANVPFCPQSDKYGSRNNNAMWQRSMIRAYLNGIDVSKIQKIGGVDLGQAKGENFEGPCNFLNEAFNLSRQPILEYTIPLYEKDIPENAFNGCVTLKKIVIHDNIQKIGRGAFDGLEFRYMCKSKNGTTVFLQEIPENREEYIQVTELDEIKKAFIGLDYGDLLKENKIDELNNLANIINKIGIKIPYGYNASEAFFDNKDFRFLQNEIPDIYDMLIGVPKEERIAFYKFANCIGCFSKKRLLDKKGRETQAILGQKATSLLVRLLKNKDMKLGNYAKLFNKLPDDMEPNQELINFLSEKGPKNNYSNIDMILELEEEYPGIFANVVQNFNDIKFQRFGIDEEGKPKRVPWKDVLKKMHYKGNYKDVTEENEDIAELFSRMQLNEWTFNTACRLRRETKIEHLLGKEIREETIEESVERIKNQTGQELADGMQTLEELYDRQFTYEWLNKKDPRNCIIGIFCDCCATITSRYYGQNIAFEVSRDEKLQNLVIRDSKGEIIAKGVMYLDRERGAGVFNSFSVNKKYQHARGKKENGEPTPEEQERQRIFEAFQRGINAFVEEYDMQNPDNPMKMITVGLSSNELKEQVQQLKITTEKVNVPTRYSFEDAYEQYILYEREEREISQIDIDSGR